MPWEKDNWEISLPILHERGYLIPAVNTADVDYIECARQLASSIREWHPDAKICLLTDRPYEDLVFDIVNLLPFGDQVHGSKWKLANDWQVFAGTPFRQTIKLESDMWCAGPIDHWWPLFEQRDLVISQGCRDYYDQPGRSRFYRKLFDNNNLPDVYNGITYWRMSQLAKEFFDLVRAIFESWDQFRTLLQYSDEIPTTDVVYGMAAVILGEENVTLPKGMGPTMVHMKKHMIPIIGNNWTHELVCEHTHPGVRINTVAQWGLVHYHHKDCMRDE